MCGAFYRRTRRTPRRKRAAVKAGRKDKGEGKKRGGEEKEKAGGIERGRRGWGDGGMGIRKRGGRKDEKGEEGGKEDAK